MKTLSKILTIGLIISLFSACAIFRQKTNNATHDEGVVINGIRWATRNVDAPGTFAPRPESSGMFFQWNRRKGWNVTDRYVENWDNSTPEGTKWYAENDPCPEGWRVPTREELEILENIDSEWTIKNGVNGRLFGIAPKQIFLPAVDRRYYIDGALNCVGAPGTYWSSNRRFGERYGTTLWFFSDRVGVSWHLRQFGFSIRCVAK